MILEAAILNVRPGQEAAFESAILNAKPLIAATPGFASLSIKRCLETRNRYLLLVQWQALQDHTVGFRQSERYQQWRALLHHFYEPFPTVEHFEDAITFGASASGEGAETGSDHMNAPLAGHEAEIESKRCS